MTIAYRRRKGQVLEFCIVLLTLLIVVPLFSLLFYVTVRGLKVMSVDFFTQLPKSVGSAHTGLGNAIAGSLLLLALSCGMGVPIGLFAGIYLAEYGKNRYGRVIRFLTEVFSGLPSIVMGVTVYGLIVVRQHHFSGFAGGVALALLMIPWMTIATQEMLQTVPRAQREGALALGIPHWKMLLHIVLKEALPGLITGGLLSVARVIGETAPLLFTALNSRYFPSSLFREMASLPVSIYTYAIQPYKDRQELAWGGAFVLLLFIALLSLGVRLVSHTGYSSRRQ